MSSATLTLTEEMSLIVDEEIASGRFSNPMEVVGAALHALKMEDEACDQKMVALRNAIDEGDESGEAEGDVFAEIRAEIGLSPRNR